MSPRHHNTPADRDEADGARKRKRDRKRPAVRKAFRSHSKRRKSGDLHTIPSFCESNAISESTYYSLKRRGKHPRELEIDGTVRITEQAEADWRREREA